jgi:hypothetical protein
MTLIASHNPDLAAAPSGSGLDTLPNVPSDPLEQQLNELERPALNRFNRMPNPKQALAMVVGSTAVGAFIEGYTISGSTTRGFVHMGAELGHRAITAVSNFFGDTKVL